VAAVEACHLGAELFIVSVFSHLEHGPLRSGFADRLPVGSDVAIFVSVAQPDFQRIELEFDGDAFDGVLDHEDALGSAKTSVGRVGRQVGAAGAASDPGVGDVISVFGMKESTFQDRYTEIGVSATVAHQFYIPGLDDPFGVKADPPAALERMAFPSDQHVFVAAQFDLDGTSTQMGRQTCQAGPKRCRSFFSAKCSAQSGDLDDEVVGRDAQHVRQHFLHLHGALGGRLDGEGMALARDGPTALSFHVKVFLSGS